MTEWAIDIQGPNGGGNIASDVPYKDFQITWAIDGAGAAAVTLEESQLASHWTPGLHRAVMKLNGVAKFAGYINRLSRSGPPRDLTYLVTVNGLAQILDFRYIHKPQVFAAVDTPVGEIAWQLIDAVQGQINGDMGFTQGAMVGTTVSKSEGYCDGSNVGDEIRYLASIGRGFDYEIDATGSFNVWNNNRGTDLSGSITLAPTPTIDWTSEVDTSDLITSASAYGTAEKPWGPQRIPVRAFTADTYGRREAVIDVDSKNEEKLEDAATALLEVQGGASVGVQANWFYDQGPWAFETVWLQDKVSVVMEPELGGTQDMRCVEISLRVEAGPAPRWWIEQTFNAVVEDVTIDGEGA